MSPLYVYNGKILIRDGKLAADQNCCCEVCVPGDSFYHVKMEISNLTVKGVRCVTNSETCIDDCAAQFPGLGEDYWACVCDCYTCSQTGPTNWQDIPDYDNRLVLASYWYYTDGNGNYAPNGIQSDTYSYHGTGTNPTNINDLSTYFDGCYDGQGLSIFDEYGCDVGGVWLECGCYNTISSYIGAFCSITGNGPGNCWDIDDQYGCNKLANLFQGGCTTNITGNSISNGIFSCDIDITVTQCSPAGAANVVNPGIDNRLFTIPC